VTSVFLPPAGQTMTPLNSWGDIGFFSLEGGSGEQEFSNILAYLDGGIRQLTANGPGWLAELYLPVYYPGNYPPDAIISDVAIIELMTTNGDRRDVIVVLLPEPAMTFMVTIGFLALRRGRRANLPISQLHAI
jgi:hypothetical protein